MQRTVTKRARNTSYWLLMARQPHGVEYQSSCGSEVKYIKIEQLEVAEAGVPVLLLWRY